MDHNNTKPSIGKKLLSIREVEISREPLELYNILKFENMVENGGEAKTAVAAGHVLLNGQVETHKRKKITAGDIIECAEEKFESNSHQRVIRGIMTSEEPPHDQ